MHRLSQPLKPRNLSPRTLLNIHTPVVSRHSSSSHRYICLQTSYIRQRPLTAVSPQSIAVATAATAGVARVSRVTASVERIHELKRSVRGYATMENVVAATGPEAGIGGGEVTARKKMPSALTFELVAKCSVRHSYGGAIDGRKCFDLHTTLHRLAFGNDLLNFFVRLRKRAHQISPFLMAPSNYPFSCPSRRKRL